ncbi:unnamed protein product [Tilletia controversa]|nr:unnamed protein product [Tilletia controversa]
MRVGGLPGPPSGGLGLGGGLTGAAGGLVLHPDLKAINVTPPTKNALPDSSTTTVKPNTNATVVPNGAPSQTLPHIVFTVGQSGSTALISLADHTGNASLLDADGPPRLHAPSAPSSGINTSAVAHQDVTGKGLY